MALETFAGTLTAPTATGSQAYTGVGFQGKAIIFAFGWQGTSGPGSTGIGCATSSTQRWSVCVGMDDGPTTMNTVHSGSTTNCITITNVGAGTTKKQADFTSFDADGFTLNWGTADATANVTVYYWVLGGDELAQAKAGTFQFGNATGDVSTTDPGFQPDLVLLAHTVSSTIGAAAHGWFGIGAASSAANQAAFAQVTIDNIGTSSVNSYFQAGKISSYWNGAGDTYVAALTTLDDQGFTVNVSDAGTINITHGYLALRGARWKVGVESQKTSTGTKATTGVGFAPLGLYLFGSANPQTTGSAAQHFTPTQGATDGGAEWSVQAFDLDNAANATNANFESVTKCLLFGDTVGGTAAEADLSTLDADGFTLDWTTADATAREFVYIAVGVAGADTGGGIAGLVGSGVSASEFVEAGAGKVGTVGAGASEFSGGVVFLKVGHALVGAIGSGAVSVTRPPFAKAGRGIVGLTTSTAGSEFHGDVVPRGVSIAFGSTTLNPYPTWTRIDT